MALFTNKIPHPAVLLSTHDLNNYIVYVMALITSQWLSNCDFNIQIISHSREHFSQHRC